MFGLFGKNKKELEELEVQMFEENKDDMEYVKDYLGDDCKGFFIAQLNEMFMGSNSDKYSVFVSITESSFLYYNATYVTLGQAVYAIVEKITDENNLEKMGKLGYKYLNKYNRTFTFISPSGNKEEWERDEINAFLK